MIGAGEPYLFLWLKNPYLFVCMVYIQNQRENQAFLLLQLQMHFAYSNCHEPALRFNSSIIFTSWGIFLQNWKWQRRRCLPAGCHSTSTYYRQTNRIPKWVGSVETSSKQQTLASVFSSLHLNRNIKTSLQVPFLAIFIYLINKASPIIFRKPI